MKRTVIRSTAVNVRVARGKNNQLALFVKRLLESAGAKLARWDLDDDIVWTFTVRGLGLRELEPASKRLEKMLREHTQAVVVYLEGSTDDAEVSIYDVCDRVARMQSAVGNLDALFTEEPKKLEPKKTNSQVEYLDWLGITA